MSRLFSLAAAGALLLSTASLASAEPFDVRAHLLTNKFGDALSGRIERRQDSADTTTTLATVVTIGNTGDTHASAPTGSELASLTTDILPKSTTSTPSLTSSATTSLTTGTSKYWDGPSSEYVVDMCLPNLLDTARAKALGIDLTVTSQSAAYAEAAKLAISLGGSPFPCEQSIYIEYACHANATKPVDYLAEQQCYCGSTFFNADQACNDCFVAHGLLVWSKDVYSQRMESFSSKVCVGTPAAGGIAAVAKTDLPDQTAVDFTFAAKSEVANPSKTNVELYATPKPMSVPVITGEATARATTWGNWVKAATASSTSSSGDSGTTSTSSDAGISVAPMVCAIFGAMALGAGLVL